MVSKTAVRNAMKAGHAQAKDILEFRAKQLRVREDVVRKRKAPAQPKALPSAKLMKAAGTSSPDPVLVAEGDSWFDYPFNDVLRMLEDRHGFDVESVAHKGDRVEQMAYGEGQLEEFTRRIEKLLRQGRVPRAILLSGGGNDIAGDEFSVLLNHVRSPVAGLNKNIIEGLIGERLLFAYVTILTAVTDLCKARLGKTIPIMLHGYAYAVPDGRGFAGGWSPLPGPWLEPGFRDKGFDDMDLCKRIIVDLIDRFNDMLDELITLPAFSHVTRLDFRKQLPNDAQYKKYWANELHPTPLGYEIVANAYAAALSKLGVV